MSRAFTIRRRAKKTRNVFLRFDGVRLRRLLERKNGESDGHPIIGHYVIGALVMKKSTFGKVAPTNIMTIDRTPAFTDPPPCARFARRLAHSHGSLR